MNIHLTIRTLDDGTEIRTYMQTGLVCPDSMDYMKRHRSWDDLQAEYNLLHAAEVTEEDALKILLAMVKTK